MDPKAIESVSQLHKSRRDVDRDLIRSQLGDYVNIVSKDENKDNDEIEKNISDAIYYSKKDLDIHFL